MMPNRIKEWREARRLTLEQLAELCETSPGQISKLENGKRKLTQDWLTRIARALAVSASDLLPSDHTIGHSDRNYPSDDRNSVKGQQIRPFQKAPLVINNSHDLPVYGAAMGGSGGDFYNDGHPKEYVQRPHNLGGVMNAYALYMYGTSMEPRYFEGEMLYINPNKPVRKGCFVAVEKNDGSGLVKQFVSKNNDFLVLRQFNPAQELRIPLAEIKVIHRVVGAGE